MNEPSADRPIIALVADLIFASKISGTAGQLGVPVAIVRTPEEVLASARDGSSVIVDMAVDTGDPLALVRELRTRWRPKRIIAFVSHVQVELTRETRAAGADAVFTRSEFTQRLPAILEELARN